MYVCLSVCLTVCRSVCDHDSLRIMPHENSAQKDRKHCALGAGCSKTDPKIFAPPQTPFPVARDGQNLINRKPYVLYHMVTFPMTLTDP